MRSLLARHPALSAFVAAFVICLTLGGAWAVASPIVSGPDENAHMIKAASVVRGDLTGEAIPGEPGFRQVMVPDFYGQLRDSLCYVFVPEQPANCGDHIDGSLDTSVPVPTAAGTYNPMYYALVGWPSLFLENEPALYGMRFVSVALNALALASGFAALALRRTNAYSLLAASIALTPMVLFLTAVVNPSGLEISTGFALACWLSTLVSSTRRGGDLVPVVGVAVNAIVLANTRQVGPLWAAVIIVAFLIEWRVWVRLARSAWFWAAAVGIAVAVAYAAWWMTSGVPDYANREGLEGAGGITFREGAEHMLSITLHDLHGYIGYFGWLDTMVPQTIVFLWAGSMLALVAAAVFFGRGWHLAKLVALIVAFVAIPPLLQGWQWDHLGYIWQQRYLLAILAALLIVAGATLDESIAQPRTSRPLRIAMALFGFAFVSMQCFAFLWALKRYIIGLGDLLGWSLMFSAPQWNTPFLDWKLLCLVFGVACLAGYWIVVARILSLWPFEHPGDAVPADADAVPAGVDAVPTDADAGTAADAPPVTPRPASARESGSTEPSR